MEQMGIACAPNPLRPDQKASSRLPLVLWPATTIERLTISDFMKKDAPSVYGCADRAPRWLGSNEKISGLNEQIPGRMSGD
jgi:hypothetical protein